MEILELKNTTEIKNSLKWQKKEFAELKTDQQRLCSPKNREKNGEK